ncbi:exported hypothetical protein [Candidatus Competibacter denitrificans Run_A_D11]|uniref:Uncharacterized protein n=1 Tax=Candidatus Competibacter denitrificans Run_A_D11 TaxID=1400863 RepID=W6ME46_9GAMM|nr:exported hypothetical protein [Candidatus Competibacter denitrificans Run_A_D11]
MTYSSSTWLISCGLGSLLAVAGAVSSISSRMMSLHSSTHSSQMNTFGPAISLRTSCWLLPQKEQYRSLSSLLSLRSLLISLPHRRAGWWRGRLIRRACCGHWQGHPLSPCEAIGAGIPSQAWDIHALGLVAETSQATRTPRDRSAPWR